MYPRFVKSTRAQLPDELVRFLRSALWYLSSNPLDTFCPPIDICFDYLAGDVVGLVGPNGAENPLFSKPFRASRAR